jgi:pheromone shutdown protein TraB
MTNDVKKSTNTGKTSGIQIILNVLSKSIPLEQLRDLSKFSENIIVILIYSIFIALFIFFFVFGYQSSREDKFLSLESSAGGM